MIETIQGLKQKIKWLTDEIDRKTKAIHVLEEKYVEHMKKRARQPGPEVIEQLEKNKIILNERQEKLNKILKETDVYNKQVKDLTYQIGFLKRELNEKKFQHVKFEYKIQSELGSNQEGIDETKKETGEKSEWD